jgi:hypothetical protein
MKKPMNYDKKTLKTLTKVASLPMQKSISFKMNIKEMQKIVKENRKIRQQQKYFINNI